MELPANIPPIICAPAPPRRSFEPAIVFAFVALAILAATLTGHFNIALPQCTFKTVTGLPCAFCGATRSLRAIGHLHFLEAFWFNPLVTISAFVSFVSVMFWMVSQNQFDRAAQSFKRLPLVALSLAAVALNWIFVLKFLPR